MGVFRPFGLDHFLTSKHGLTPWAAFLRCFAASYISQKQVLRCAKDDKIESKGMLLGSLFNQNDVGICVAA